MTLTHVHQALNDFRGGFRILWKSPGISVMAAILVALVIGLNTSIYSLDHALITRPAPGVRLRTWFSSKTSGMEADPVQSYAAYLDFAAQTKMLRNLLGHGAEPMTLGTEDGSYGMFGALRVDSP
jgi:hypothetical protein